MPTDSQGTLGVAPMGVESSDQRALAPTSDRLPRVLIIDDHAGHVRLMRKQLENAGYVATGAESGRAGLAAAHAAPPDLILLDVLMPGMDGYEVCRQLKDDPATGAVPVLMVSGLYEQADKVRGLEAGADDFLSK